MLAGCQMPTQLPSPSPASRGLAEKGRWRSWVEMQTGRWLGNYCHGQNRLDLGETNLIFLHAPGVQAMGGLWPVQWWSVSGGSVVEPAVSSTGQPLTPSHRSPPAAPTAQPGHAHPVHAHISSLCCAAWPGQPDPWPPNRCLQLFLPAVRVSRWWALTRMLILSLACGGPLWCFILATCQGVQFLRHRGNDQIIFITSASEFTVLQTSFPVLLLGSKMSLRRMCHQMQDLFLGGGLQKLPYCSNTNVTSCGLLFTAFLI